MRNWLEIKKKKKEALLEPLPSLLSTKEDKDMHLSFPFHSSDHPSSLLHFLPLPLSFVTSRAASSLSSPSGQGMTMFILLFSVSNHILFFAFSYLVPFPFRSHVNVWILCYTGIVNKSIPLLLNCHVEQ